MEDKQDNPIVSKLRELQAAGAVSAFSVSESGEDGRPNVWVSWVGPPDGRLTQFRVENPTTEAENLQDFYFFGNELRPGSGLIRVFGGKSEGPGGTLTCILTSESGGDTYFASAGHVMSDFWRDIKGRGSIYRYRPGFPPSGSTRFLGKKVLLPKHWPKPFKKERPKRIYLKDVGIVKLAVDAELKQRTTCYGTFGECPPGKSCEALVGRHVIKCGSQETYGTEAVVKDPNAEITILGPDNTCYIFRKQIILRDLCPCEPREATCARNSPETPFAVPGDSGTMVVDSETKTPLGMLIAGSILDGLYVVTPFSIIKEFFDERKLVMMRA